MRISGNTPQYRPIKKTEGFDEDVSGKHAKKFEIAQDYYLVTYGPVTQGDVSKAMEVLKKVPKEMLAEDGKVVVQVTKRPLHFLNGTAAVYNGSTDIRSTTRDSTSHRTYQRIDFNLPVITKKTLAHEVGHAIMSEDRNRQILLDNGWPTEQDYVQGKHPELNPLNSIRRPGFVTSYARTNMEEDMAETIAFYLEDREKFLEMAQNDPVLMQKYKAVDALFNHYNSAN